MDASDWLTWITEAHDGDTWEERALEAAVALTPEQIGGLVDLLETPPERPVTLDTVYPDPADWLAIWQQAIFEVLYLAHDTSFDLLREMAFGAYNWEQAWALQTLGRLAIDGIRREEIVDEIGEMLPTFEGDMVFVALDAVMSVGHLSVGLIHGIERAFEVWFSADPLATLRACELIAGALPEMTMAHRATLNTIMTADDSPEALRAAVVLHHLYPNDPRIGDRLAQLGGG